MEWTAASVATTVAATSRNGWRFMSAPRSGQPGPEKVRGLVDDQDTVHLWMQLGGAALRRAVEVVASGDVDLERHGQRRTDHRAVDEHALIEPVEREAVAGTQA